MDLKKKLKAFLTWNRRANGGFTLVELIVVIAILAILAGVAVPAYNGYINKANKAADDALIAEINLAAGTAVLEVNGKDMSDYGIGDLKSNASQTAPEGGILVYEKADNDMTGPLVAAFAKYFEGDSTATLKWYKEVIFKGGRFVGSRGGLLESIFKDNHGAGKAFKDSSYAAIGVEGVTEMVDSLAGALSDYPALSRVTKTGAFGKTLDILGIDPATADKQTLANAAVFHVANYTSQLNSRDIWSHIQEGDLDTWLETGTGLGLTRDDAMFLGTALQYASATAYAYSEFATDEERAAIAEANPKGRGEAMTIIANATAGDGYLGYLYDEEEDAVNGMNDFDAFYKIMQCVTDNTENFNSFEGGQFFSNEEVVKAMKELLGENKSNS